VKNVARKDELKGGHCLIELSGVNELITGQDMLHYVYTDDILDEIECFSLFVNGITKQMGRHHRFSNNDPIHAKIAGYLLERTFITWCESNCVPYKSGGIMRTREDEAHQDFTIYGKTVGCKSKLVEKDIWHTIKKYSSWLYPAKNVGNSYHMLPTPDYMVFGLHEAATKSVYIFGWTTKEAIESSYLRRINGYPTRMVEKKAWNSMSTFKEELEKGKG
jgi:hypothetical protein